MGFAAGDENLKRYVGNKSTSSIDPRGLEEDGLQSVWYAFGQGFMQGVVNTANGVTDNAIGLANLVVAIPNTTADLISGSNPNNLRITYIPSPDWSRDMFVHETDMMHNMSKFIGAFGVELLSGTAISRVRALRGLSNAETVVADLPIINSSFVPKPTTVGRVGEAVAGIPTGLKKTPIEINGRTRIPDLLTTTLLKEVKNVAKLSKTVQIQDFADFAKKNDLLFELWIRESTKLSGPLKQLIKDNGIIIEILKGL